MLARQRREEEESVVCVRVRLSAASIFFLSLSLLLAEEWRSLNGLFLLVVTYCRNKSICNSALLSTRLEKKAGFLCSCLSHLATGKKLHVSPSFFAQKTNAYLCRFVILFFFASFLPPKSNILPSLFLVEEKADYLVQ